MGKTTFVSPATQAKVSGLSEIQQMTLDWIGTGRDVTEIFRGPASLVSRLDQTSQAYEHKLEMRQLLVDADTDSKLRRWKWTVATIIAGLGLYKVGIAILVGNWNIIFALMLLAVGIAAALYIGRSKRLTDLGVLYLDRLQNTFGNLGYASRQSLTTAESEPGRVFATVDPLLVSVGLFGTVALAGTAYTDYDDAFQKAQRNSAGGSGGCGSGCSSGSSSSSCSGGDSGGSSCASGCGGCGGGD